MAYPYSKNERLKATGPETKNFQVTRVKTDGRIGSATPPAWLKGGFTVDNNKKAGPPADIGAQAAGHMSVGHDGGNSWSPRVAKARAMAAKHPREAHTRPINVQRAVLKRMKPD